MYKPRILSLGITRHITATSSIIGMRNAVRLGPNSTDLIIGDCSNVILNFS